MSAQLTEAAAGDVSRDTSVVWRWKGTRADIVRIARAVVKLTGASSLVIELTDAMGRSMLADAAELDRTLDEVEKFTTVAFEAGDEQESCRVKVFFDATGDRAPAAVTVFTSGTNLAAVAKARLTVERLIGAGARAPKKAEPAQLKKWGIFISLALLVLATLGLLEAKNRDPGSTPFVFAQFVVGGAGMALWLGLYEVLMPRVELLRKGQTPRIQKFARWIAATVGAVVVGGMASRVF